MATVDTPQTDPHITITDVGPNQSVTIPLPAEGGVTVLRGRNDLGKTEALKAVSVLAGRKDKLAVRQDAPLGTKGIVSGGGVELSVTGSTRRKGEAEFTVLDGRLSMADLVDPGVKDVEAGDTKRIKALLSLADAKPDASQFHNLVGGPEAFEKLLPPAAIEDADLITIAVRVKRALDAQAREAEGQVALHRGKAKGLRAATGTLNIEVVADGDVLQGALEQAIAADSALKQQRLTALLEEQKLTEARAWLDTAESDYTGMSMAEAQHTLEEWEKSLSLSVAKYDQAMVDVRMAEKSIERCTTARGHVHDCLKIAEDHEALVAGWHETLGTVLSAGPTDEQIAGSEAHVRTARQAVEQGALVRQAQEQLAKAGEADTAATIYQKLALESREAAKGTDDVLSDIVATLGCPLRVRGGRLVVDRDGREKFYAELSAGARWKLALDIGIDAVGEHGLLPLPQGAWEGLDPTNRSLIAQHVQGSRVNIITAECSDCETVEAEVFEGKK